MRVEDSDEEQRVSILYIRSPDLNEYKPQTHKLLTWNRISRELPATKKRWLRRMNYGFRLRSSQKQLRTFSRYSQP